VFVKKLSGPQESAALGGGHHRLVAIIEMKYIAAPKKTKNEKRGFPASSQETHQSTFHK
jgi:hypothetical protein